MKIMIVVTHLLGSGHLSRALTLGRALGAAGHHVTVLSGGTPVAHLDAQGLSLVQLPPLKSDGVNFTRLLDGDGQHASEQYMRQREAMVLDRLHRETPNVLITELFPFGRRVLSTEFLALLTAAKAMQTPPLILGSVRDILAPPSSQKKADRTEAIVMEYYDSILVHSVEDVVPLSVSWPVTDALNAKLRYTGFVAPPPRPPSESRIGQDEVLVSAGGGAVGDHLFNAAAEAATLDRTKRWRVLVGGTDPGPRIEALRRRYPGDNIIIEPARPDFRDLLRNAAVSVSMCGYNTALDVLQTATPAIFVPFDEGGEVEQGLRANSLARTVGIAVVQSKDLTGARLLDQVDKIAGQERLPVSRDQFEGANQTVRLLEELGAAR